MNLVDASLIIQSLFKKKKYPLFFIITSYSILKIW